MAKNFDELREAMSPERRARNAARPADELCPSCRKGRLVTRTTTTATRVANKTVIQTALLAFVCDSCDYYSLTSQELRRLELKAALSVLTKVAVLSGPDLKFARKALGLTREELAKALTVPAEIVPRWEADEGIAQDVSQALSQLILEALRK